MLIFEDPHAHREIASVDGGSPAYWAELREAHRLIAELRKARAEALSASLYVFGDDYLDPLERWAETATAAEGAALVDRRRTRRGFRRSGAVENIAPYDRWARAASAVDNHWRASMIVKACGYMHLMTHS